MAGWLLRASSALGWALLALSLIDLRCHRLPDPLTLTTLLAGLSVTLIARPAALPEHLIGTVLGYAALAGIGWLYRVLRGRDGIGLGDAKLLAAGGAWLSWQAIPGIILSAAALELLPTLIVRLVQSAPLSATTRIPFGPYLAAAIWLAWLYGPLELVL
jgi:leader peptidase (prepilin peptidase)/N-methyltransferase